MLQNKENKSKNPSASEPKPKQSRKKKSEPAEIIPVNDVYKGLALETLKECKSSHCTHPSFQYPEMPAGSWVSPYWTRNAVGVLVTKRLVKNAPSPKAASKERKTNTEARRNIAYFSGKTTCAHTNFVLAGIFVSRW